MSYPLSETTAKRMYTQELRREIKLYEGIILANGFHPDPEYGKLIVHKHTEDLLWTREALTQAEAELAEMGARV